MEKIEMGLVHYAYFRPHQALAGATPAEIYFGRTPSHLSAIPPPRGRTGLTRANNAIVSLSESSTTFSVFNNSATTVDFILDVNGFFR